MSQEFVLTENLCVGYEGVPLIRDICLKLRKGEIGVLIGPNGSGKSTILKSIIRQLAPLGGVVRLDGEDLAAKKGPELAKKIASVLPGGIPSELMTVRDVVALGRYPYTGTLGILSDKDQKIIDKSMEDLEIESLQDRYFTCLSDGQRQRVILARALAQEPELLVLDEPTTYLDIRYQLELSDILKKLAREEGLTVLLSLHELELARQMADVVICVKDQKIAEVGTPEEIFRPEHLEELFHLPEGAYRSYRGDFSAPEEKEEHYILSDGKKLRCGFTTGTCATLAAQACAIYLLGGIWPETVSVRTAKGWKVSVHPERREEENHTVRCGVKKDGGDDADRTDGITIYATVELCENPAIEIDGGEGIGRVTKPGLDQEVGQAAINSVPRQMIQNTLKEVFQDYGYTGGAKVTISAPEGKEIAGHTFNPMLGIEGGISILGTSGVVEPMSVQALVSTIEISLRQAREEGSTTVVLTPGNYGLDYLRNKNIPPRGVPVVQVSNYIGQALDLCGILGFSQVLLVGHVGKLIKLAGGIMNTHSRVADCRRELMCAHAALCGADRETCRTLMECATTDGCIAELDRVNLKKNVMESLTEAIDQNLLRRADGKYICGALLFSKEYGELGRTAAAKGLLEAWEKNGR